MLLRRFFSHYPQRRLQKIPHYVKVVGLPDETWPSDLKKLLGDEKYEFMPRRSYIAIETWSAEEAEHVKNLIHMKKLDENTVVKATNLLTVSEMDWVHPIFHIRSDFTVPPLNISKQEFEQLHKVEPDCSETSPDQEAEEKSFHEKVKKHLQETEVAEKFASLVKKQPKIV